MARPHKVTLGYLLRERQCIGLEAWCQSGLCAGAAPRLLLIPELLNWPGVTEATRLDEIEARLRCVSCATRGASELRPDPYWTQRAAWSGVDRGD